METKQKTVVGAALAACALLALLMTTRAPAVASVSFGKSSVAPSETAVGITTHGFPFSAVAHSNPTPFTHRDARAPVALSSQVTAGPGLVVSVAGAMPGLVGRELPSSESLGETILEGTTYSPDVEFTFERNVPQDVTANVDVANLHAPDGFQGSAPHGPYQIAVPGKSREGHEGQQVSPLTFTPTGETLAEIHRAPIAAVPEPRTYLMMLCGLIGIVSLRRRRQG